MSVIGRADHIQVAKVIGIPIYLHFSWLIIFGLIVWTLSTGYFPAKYPDLPASSYWAKGLVASLLFFVSILLHELGHAVVARLHGLRTRSITLFIFGGVAQLEKDPKDGRAEFWMAAAGPVVSLALAGVFYACATLPFVGPSAAAVAKYLALINLILAVFNLVPAFPMDGGRLLRGALWGPLGKARATRIASTAGTFFAFLLIFIGVFSLTRGDALGGLWYILIGWFIKDASAASYQQVRLDEALRGVTVRDAMVDAVVTVPSSRLRGRSGPGAVPANRLRQLSREAGRSRRRPPLPQGRPAALGGGERGDVRSGRHAPVDGRHRHRAGRPAAGGDRQDGPGRHRATPRHARGRARGPAHDERGDPPPEGARGAGGIEPD